jgi:serine/threonine-protein kinase
MTDPTGEPPSDASRTEPAGSEDPWVGRTLAGKFRVGPLIGEGAMGRVHRGEHLSLGKPVALKVLHRHLGGDPRIARRFHREAKAASRLSHPNSLQIIDFGEAEDGTLYIAMELLEGDDLQALIDREAPLSPARIGELMTQTLRAVDEAHHAGIIHRDLKPENVVVLRDRGGRERVKVCDFGIAKITESEGRSTAITKDGYVCGTPEYMAPEQAKGDRIDARVDVYAAGVMLYQMLCGEVPFRAQTALGLITKHIMDPPRPPRRVKPAWGIPRSLQRVALRALRKAPSDRYPSAGAMARAIEEAVAALGPQARERLGHGSFARAAEEDPDEDEALDPADASAATTEERIPPRAPPAAGRGWLLALAAAVAVLGFGVWLWVKDAPPTARPAAPPLAAAPAPTSGAPEPTAREATDPRNDASRGRGEGPPTATARGADGSGGAPPRSGPDDADRVARANAGERAAAVATAPNSGAAFGGSAAEEAGGEPGGAPPTAAGSPAEPAAAAAEEAGGEPGGAPPPAAGSPAEPAAAASAEDAPRAAGAGAAAAAPGSDRSPPEPGRTEPSPGQRSLARGRRQMLRGDLRGAIASFRAAARAMPGSAEAQKQLGRAHMRNGDVSRGIAAYRRYLDLAPDAPDRAIVERIIGQHHRRAR